MSKITIDRAVLELAIDALEKERPYLGPMPSKTIAAITALSESLAQPQQEPVATLKDTVLGCFGAAFAEGLQEVLEETQDARLRDLVERRLMHALYAAQDTSPPARNPLTDGVLVPLDILEAAESSLGSFCSDLGWSADDMQAMDNLSAYIAKHKAAHGIKDTP